MLPIASIIAALLQTTMVPVELGRAGTWILLVFTLALALLNAYQWRKSGEATHWRGASEAFKAELQIVRERCQRLETSNEAQAKENAVLRSRTDLDSLRAQTNTIQTLLTDHVSRVAERHEAILKGLSELARTVGDMHQRFLDRDEEYADLIRAQGELIKSLQSQLNLKAAMTT